MRANAWPDNSANAPVQTDYDNSLNGTNVYGGVCTSCHRNVQTKRQPGTDIKADGMAYTYIVDNATYGPSIHGYPASASPITGHFSSMEIPMAKRTVSAMWVAMAAALRFPVASGTPLRSMERTSPL